MGHLMLVFGILACCFVYLVVSLVYDVCRARKSKKLAKAYSGEAPISVPTPLQLSNATESEVTTETSKLLESLLGNTLYQYRVTYDEPQQVTNEAPQLPQSAPKRPKKKVAKRKAKSSKHKAESSKRSRR